MCKKGIGHGQKCLHNPFVDPHVVESDPTRFNRSDPTRFNKLSPEEAKKRRLRHNHAIGVADKVGITRKAGIADKASVGVFEKAGIGVVGEATTAKKEVQAELDQVQLQ